MKRRFTLAVALCLLILAFAPASISQTKPTKSEWTFPAPGIKSRYDRELKGTIYDLGDGFHAHRRITGSQFLVFVSLPERLAEMEDSDLALVVASKVLKLPRLLSDTLLERESEFEFRFRTAGGRVAGVTLAHDRKSAIVRLIPVTEEAEES